MVACAQKPLYELSHTQKKKGDRQTRGTDSFCKETMWFQFALKMCPKYQTPHFYGPRSVKCKNNIWFHGTLRF